MVCSSCKGKGYNLERTGLQEVEQIPCEDCGSEFCPECGESYSLLVGYCSDCYSNCTSCNELTPESKMQTEESCKLCFDEDQ